MKRKTLVVLLAIFVNCQDAPTETDQSVPEPVLQIQDAVHNSGNKHFFFLPPMVSNPVTSGLFDGSLSPVVKICNLGPIVDPTLLDATTPCLAPQPPFPITFSTTTGPGSETVRVNGVDEHYIANWHTDLFSLAVDNTYRIRISVAGTGLGLADVDAVSNGKQLKNVNTGEFIALKDGRTLPIKFRIEEGAVFVIGAGEGAFTAAEGAVQMDIPAGALPGDVGITVELDVTHPPAEGIIDGAGFEFGPDGLVFAFPVTLTIAYDEANLPLGFPETGLTLATQLHEEGDVWEEILSTVDVVANTVTGTITGFSNHNVKKKATSVDVDPTSATLGIGEIVQLAATPRDALGDPLANQNIIWSSSVPAVATVVRKTGLVTAVTAGTVTIEAKTKGTTGTAAITVVSPGVVAQIDAILNDPFATQLVTHLSTTLRSQMEATLAECTVGIGVGNLTIVNECLATARSQVGTATDPTDRVLLAVFDRLLDFAERLLNP